MRALPLLALAWLLLIPAPTRAQTAAQRALLRLIGTLYKQGKAQTQRKDYPGAIRSFTRAYKLLQDGLKDAKGARQRAPFLELVVPFLYILGKTHQYAKAYAKAYPYYRRCIARGRGSQAGAACKQELASILGKLKAQISIRATGPAREVQVLLESPQGTVLGRPPLKRSLNPGPWTFQLKAQGYPTWTRQLELQPHQRLRFHFRFCRGRVYLNKACPPKTSRLRKQPPRPKVPAPRTPGAAVGVLITGGVLAVAGAILVGSSRGLAPGVEQKIGDPTFSTSQIAAEADTLVALHNTGLVLFGVAGVAILVGGGWLLFGR